MKKIALFLMLITAVLYIDACSNRAGTDRGSNTGRTGRTGGTGDETGGGVGNSNTNNSSEMNMRAEFIRDAADGGMAEVQLGNLALQRASSQPVKDFAQMMVDDHSKANDQLKDVASTDNINIPSSLSDDHQNDVAKLQKLSGTEFDQEYIDMMVKDHEKDVSKFEDASKNITDPQVKSWVDQTLPTLRHHLDMAKQVRDQIKKQ